MRILQGNGASITKHQMYHLMSSFPGMFRANVSILLFGARTGVLFLVRGLYCLLFNRIWSNDGLAHTAIFMYSPRVMSLLVFDAVLFSFVLFLGYFGFADCAMVIRNTVYYWCRLPCT